MRHSSLVPNTDALSTSEFDALRNRLWEEGAGVVREASQLYVDVDVEADGKAGYGSMLSVGAQSPTGESFYSEIKPYSDNFIAHQKRFCEEHGLERERLMVEAPSLRDVMPRLADWLTDLREMHGKRSVLTAFNAAFDYAHVDLAFALAGYERNPFGIAPNDLKSLALPLGVDWDWNSTSKDNLPKIIVPDEDFTHHALEDAQWQQKIHFGMAALLGSRA